MWSDTDIALAPLITFRCYGTWLHGDDRGSVDRFHNQYQGAYAAPNRNRYQHNQNLLKGESVTLDSIQRACVEKAIRETCVLRVGHCVPSTCGLIMSTLSFQLERRNLNLR
jgi:hypothetical protein